MAISDYSTTRDSNASIAPGDLRSNDYRRDQQIINAIRQLMADLALLGAGTDTMARLRLTSTDDASLSSTLHPLQIGLTSGLNTIYDNNEIMARNNGAISALNLNAEGGIVSLHSGAPTDANSILQLNGGKIFFPAAQQASSDANTLDDYEEGTWTPVLEFGGASVGMTYSTQVGKYVKVGQLAFVQGRIILTAKGSSTGQARISGLPFTSNSNHNYTPIRIGYWQALTTVTGQPGAYVETSNIYANIGQSGGGGFAGLTEANFQNTSDIIFAGCYRTSA